MADRRFRIIKVESSDAEDGVKNGDVALLNSVSDSGGVRLADPGHWNKTEIFFHREQVVEVSDFDTPSPSLSPCYEASRIMKAMLCDGDCYCSRCRAAQGWIAAFPIR